MDNSGQQIPPQQEQREGDVPIMSHSRQSSLAEGALFQELGELSLGSRSGPILSPKHSSIDLTSSTTANLESTVQRKESVYSNFKLVDLEECIWDSPSFHHNIENCENYLLHLEADMRALIPVLTSVVEAHESKFIRISTRKELSILIANFLP